MPVTDQSTHVLEHAGAPIYFCSAGCKAKFATNPAQYLAAPAAVAAPPLPGPEPALAGTVYTCPIHPEVRQDHPGACPKSSPASSPASASFPAAILRMRVGPHQTIDRTAPSNRMAAAVQNGAIGANVNNEPALIEPSAWPRLPAAAWRPSSAPSASALRSSNSYDSTGPIIPAPVATTAIISPSDPASGTSEVNARASAEPANAAATQR